MKRAYFLISLCFVIAAAAFSRGDIVARMQDEQAAQALARADQMYHIGRYEEAVTLYRNLIREFPQSTVKYTAMLKLGEHLFERGEFATALTNFHRVAEESEEDAEIARAMLMKGRCFFEMEQFDSAFTVLRDLAESYPGTAHSNQAYYYVGLAHMRLNNFNQAIDAFRMVGTSVEEDDPQASRIAPGRTLFIRVRDDDLRALARHRQSITIRVKTTSGDEEECELSPASVRGGEFVGSLPTKLGAPKPGDGVLQLVGSDRVIVEYIDRHTGEGEANVRRIHELEVAHDAGASFTDGIFETKVHGVALGANANIRIVDYDRSLSGERNSVRALVRSKYEPTYRDAAFDPTRETREDLLETRHEIELELSEQPAADGEYYTGVFTGAAPVVSPDENEIPGALLAEEGDLLEIIYIDERHMAGDEERIARDTARVVRGQLTPMKAFDSRIDDPLLRVRTELGLAKALLDMGRIYKDLGLQERADEKLNEALAECARAAEGIPAQDRELREQLQYLTWRIYFEQGNLNAAISVCMNLLRQFPDSEYVGDALLTMGNSELQQGNHHRAISVFRSLLNVENSVYRPDAQFNIAESYAALAENNPGYADAALQEYQKCVRMFPDSRFAPLAVMRVADYYYSAGDNARAAETYERSLRDYPDSRFAAEILLNYGKSLVRMGQFEEAMGKFQRVIVNYPESEKSEEARQLFQAVRRRLGAGGM